MLKKATWFEETAPVAISPGAGYFLHQDSTVWLLHDPSEMSCEVRSVLQEQRSDCELGTWSAGLSYSGMDQREVVVIPQHCQGSLLLERCFANKIQHQTASSHDSRNGGREKRGSKKRDRSAGRILYFFVLGHQSVSSRGSQPAAG